MVESKGKIAEFANLLFRAAGKGNLGMRNEEFIALDLEFGLPHMAVNTGNMLLNID